MKHPEHTDGSTQFEINFWWDNLTQPQRDFCLYIFRQSNDDVDHISAICFKDKEWMRSHPDWPADQMRKI